MMKTGWYAILLTLVLLVVGTVFGVVLGGFISSLQMEGNRTPELNASLPTQPPTTTPAPATTPPIYVRTTTPPPSTTPPPAVTTAPPAVVLIAPANSSNHSRVVTFNFTVTGGRAASLAFTLFIDGVANFTGTMASGTFNVTTLSIPAGLHTWSVSAGDGLQNGTSGVHTFSIDNTAPNVTLINPVDNSNHSSPVIFNFMVTDDRATSMRFILYLDGQANFIGTVPNGTFNALEVTGIPDGLRSWSVSVNDSVGNTGSSETYLFRVDGTAPVVTLLSPTNDSNFSTTNVTFNFTATDNSLNTTLNFTLYLDGQANLSGTVQNGSSNATILVIPEGSHSWFVNVSDFVNNTGMSETRFFRVTAVQPAIYVASPQNTTYSTISIQLNVSANVPVDTWQYSLNGGPNTTFVPNTTNITAPEGANNILVAANYTSGARSTAMAYFTIDTNPPLVTILSPNSTTYNASSVWVNVTLSENSGSVLAQLDSATNYTLVNASGNWNYLLNLTNGTHSVRIFANDSVGNMDSNQTVYFTVSGL